MDERVIQFRVGLLVVATLLFTVMLIWLFGEMPRRFNGEQRTIYVKFKSAPGVTVDTPVRKSGILVGRVSDVVLRNDGGVLVTAKLEPNRTIRQNEICRISTGNFLGDAMLEFVPSGVVGASTSELVEGSYLQGFVANDPLQAMRVFVDLEEDMNRALGAIQAAGMEVGEVARNLNVLVVNNQGQFNRIMARTESALGRFDTALTSVNDLVSDDELRLKLQQALDSVPQLLDDASGLVVGLQKVAERAEVNLDNLTGLTGPLGEQGERIVATIDDGLGRLDEVLEQMVVFSHGLNEGKGSLNQFVNNPDLYQRLNRAAENIELVSYQLRPILDDARVFSDKIARNPGRLVQGVLRKQQSGIK